MKELLIIGGGPAGLTASIYSARKKVDFVLITKDVGGQALWGAEIDNYLGYHLIPGTELVGKFNQHVDSFDIEKYFDEVIQFQKIDDSFLIATKANRQLKSKAVIIATGKKPRFLKIPGEKEFHGRGVTYCSTCDAPLFSGMPTLVVGGGNAGLEATMQLSMISPQVYLVTNKELTGDSVTQEKLRQKDNVKIFKFSRVKEIKGDSFVSKAALETPEGDKELDIRGIFVEIGAVPNTDLVRSLVDLNSLGEIKVNCMNETSSEAIFAAGDATNVPEKQIIVAAGEGAKAALAAYSYLCRH